MCLCKCLVMTGNTEKQERVSIVICQKAQKMSSGFISEREVAEARQIKQQQWQQNRTEDDPEEAPEEPYDPRPLFQRLEEQKNKKDADYEEAHKLKNMIRGLDDDEVGFLEMVEQSKASVARQISLEEQKEMREFRERVSTVQDNVERERLKQITGVGQPLVKKPASNSTKNKLQGVIIRKRKTSDTETKTEEPPGKMASRPDNSTNGHVNPEKPSEDNKTSNSNDNVSSTDGKMKCIGILPGIGPYKDSSDSECSSDSDDEPHIHSQYDLLGRKQSCKINEEILKDKAVPKS